MRSCFEGAIRVWLSERPDSSPVRRGLGSSRQAFECPFRRIYPIQWEQRLLANCSRASLSMSS